MHKNICFHTRLANGDQKTTGGTFGGSYDLDTIERLSKAWFTVQVRNSGRPVFVDRQGREVNVYIYVDPMDTEIGRKAVAECRAERRRRYEAEDALEQARQEELETLMDSMPHEEIVRRLKGE